MKSSEFKQLVKRISALGTKGMILVIMVSSAGVAGAAALSTGLLVLGPGGMIGGMTIMGLLLLISRAINEYGLEAILEAIIKEMQSKGRSKQSIKNEISEYWIAAGLKHRLYEAVDKA